MTKNIHEIRDPIHVFVRLDSLEREVLNSRPFQRLRHIHQLGLTYLVYPGATHKRFEHSLGVMELAGRVYDVVTRPDPEYVTDEIISLIPEISRKDRLSYWRQVLRMAALCHDIGHLPFSHTAEELLPECWDHERLTRELIMSNELAAIWKNLTPPLNPDHIVKLAVGPKKAQDLPFTDWERILSEIIVGDVFGVDRMDYLLRDSHHTGVAYGKFDHYRLIDTVRILPKPLSEEGDESKVPELGVEEGGLQSAEALLLARYFIYSQVYLHHVRRIYDIHLKDFLGGYLEGGKFPTDIESHLQSTDEGITAALWAAAFDERHPLHKVAGLIVRHQHFKVGYQRNPHDQNINREAALLVFQRAKKYFGSEKIRFDHYIEESGPPDFPVKTRDGKIVSSLSISNVINNLPPLAIDYVFVNREYLDLFKKWLQENRDDIIQPPREGEENE